MDCFKDLVGIKNTCDASVSKSGLWLQDLPGFSLKIADASISEEYVSGLELIKEKYEFAQKAISVQFRNQFSEKIKSSSILENKTFGFIPERLKSASALPGYFKGIKLTLRQSGFFEINISRIGILLKNTVNTNVYIYNLTTGELIETIAIQAQSGRLSYINIDKKITTNRQITSLFICYDSSVSDTFETNISTNFASCCGPQYTGLITASGGKIDYSSQKISSNIQSISGSSGLTLDYSLGCSIDSLLCSLSNKMAWPLMYKWGAEIMAETIYSRRLNSIVIIERSTNEALREEYESEYMSSMSAIFNSIKLPSDICIECNKRIKQGVAIP